MPKGAKKRKAAKKKKEKETEIHTNIPQGNDEVKSQDEKGSDGGEGGSPSHGDHDHPFNEGNEVEERDLSAAQPSAAAAASKDLEEVPTKTDETQGEKEGVVVIEWDMKSEESCENKEVGVGHAESAKESYHGNGNSSSSRDEGVTVKNTKDESDNSLKETLAPEKSIDSPHAKMTSITQNAQAEEAGKSGAESSVDSFKARTPVSEVKTRDAENILEEKSMNSQLRGTDLAVQKKDDKIYGLSDQNVTSNLEEAKPKEFDSKVSTSVSHSPLPESTIGAEHVKDSDTPESSENQPPVPTDKFRHSSMRISSNGPNL
ncbi:hypothetical protein VNO77_42593 [Canavalia gladiata]|uniref:Uncharacterized protein n=1 Tax=Canavalia gladiata TaxID=3824 RepID=A0AAN9JT49_CANGL